MVYSLFKFGCEGDKGEFWRTAEWHFAQSVTIFAALESSFPITPDNLHYVPFWVQIYGIPFMCKSHDLARFIASEVGDLIEVDKDTVKEGTGPYLRIRVLLDVNLSLRRGMNIRFIRMGREFVKWIDFKYERLPDFCFFCGKLDHTKRYCHFYLQKCDETQTDPPCPYTILLRGKEKIVDKSMPFQYPHPPAITLVDHAAVNLHHPTRNFLDNIISFPSFLTGNGSSGSHFLSPYTSSSVMIPTPLNPNFDNAFLAGLVLRPSAFTSYSTDSLVVATTVGPMEVVSGALSTMVSTEMMPASSGPAAAVGDLSWRWTQVVVGNSVRSQLKRARAGDREDGSSSASTDMEQAGCRLVLLRELEMVLVLTMVLSSPGSDADVVNLILDCLGPPLDGLDYAFLDAPFSTKEVRRALFNLSGDKAPGLDGLNAYFYQKNWSTLGVDFARAVLTCLNEGIDFSVVNTTLISLIPKKQNAHTLKDFRPISLCLTFYKVISKVLANRLKVVLDKIISPYQSAFVSDRVIFDNILIAQEIIHAINSRKSGKLGWAALKLDMSKAFDRVEWHYLESVMGIRQGDPLSPYLFILCAGGLSALLRAKQDIGLFKGVAISRTAPSLSHLFFSDDSLIFCTANRASCLALQEVFDVYSKASGQAINFAKSSILFSPNTLSDIRATLFNAFNLEDRPFICKYLGLPKCLSRSKYHSFAFLKDRGIEVVMADCGGVQLEILIRFFEVLEIVVSFLQAKSGHNPSFSWRSILWGRELLNLGLLWKVGDGSDIRTIEDHWIPHNRFKFFSDNLPPSPFLSYFITASGDWDVAKLANCFFAPLVDEILSVPVLVFRFTAGLDAALYFKFGSDNYHRLPSEGQVVAGLAKAFSGCVSPMVAEAKAVVHALQWAYSICLPVDVLKTDCKYIVDKLHYGTQGCSSVDDLIVCIKNLLSIRSSLRLAHVNREFNTIAHRVAKWGIGLDRLVDWVVDDSLVLKLRSSGKSIMIDPPNKVFGLGGN
uniref:Reverse transcriptase domain-containing protein n=1 Tax=Cannabis sativa TaxID=3483 RepID=A0A803PJH0_CANSA